MSSLDRNTQRLTRAASTVQNVTVRRGLGPLTILGIIFVLCKIFEVGAVGEWSWWLVLLPFYVGYAFVVGIWMLLFAIWVVAMLGYCVLFGIAHIADSWRYRYRVKPARTKKRFP